MNELGKVQCPVITQSKLCVHLLSKYNLHNVKCEFYTQSINDIYLVTCQEGIYYLRLSPVGFRTKEQLEAEVTVVCHLDENRISVATPIADKNGIFIQEIHSLEGKRYAILWNEAKGETKGIKVAVESRNLGKLFGQMHSCLDNLKVKTCLLDENNLVHKPLESIREFYGGTSYMHRLEIGGQAIASYLKDTRINQREMYGLCHGDTHNYNIKFYNMIPTLFDFDCLGYGLRMYDLAIQRWNISMFHLEASEEAKQWNELIEGYASIHPLGEKELGSINLLVATRVIWLMGVQLQGIHHNKKCEWINEHYIQSNTELMEHWISLS